MEDEQVLGLPEEAGKKSVLSAKAIQEAAMKEQQRIDDARKRYGGDKFMITDASGKAVEVMAQDMDEFIKNKKAQQYVQNWNKAFEESQAPFEKLAELGAAALPATSLVKSRMETGSLGSPRAAAALAALASSTPEVAEAARQGKPPTRIQARMRQVRPDSSFERKPTPPSDMRESLGEYRQMEARNIENYKDLTAIANEAKQKYETLKDTVAKSREKGGVITQNSPIMKQLMQARQELFSLIDTLIKAEPTVGGVGSEPKTTKSPLSRKKRPLSRMREETDNNNEGE